MKKIIILFLAFFISNVCFLCGCTEENDLKYSIVGSWKTGFIQDVGVTILTFKSDGTAEDRLDPGDVTSTGTWELNGNQLRLNLSDGENEYSFVFKIKFENNGKLLLAEEISSSNVETWERIIE
jgi:hypothetical protein